MDDHSFSEQVLLPVGAITGVERIDVAPITRQVSRSATLPAGVRGSR